VETGQNLTVRYTGSLNNGTEFDKVGPGDKPISFRLGRRQVLRVWDAGLIARGRSRVTRPWCL